MYLTIKTQPAEEPVTLEEAKIQVKADVDDDDALITRLITAARQHVEGIIGRPIIQRTYLGYADTFSTVMELSADMVSVTAIQYRDSDNIEQTLPQATYNVNPHCLIGRVELAYGQYWPRTYPAPNAVAVEFVAGMAETAAQVPEDIKGAILLALGTLYANRESVVVGVSIAEIPLSIDLLLAPYRIYKIG